jgi:hypothetical protein
MGGGEEDGWRRGELVHKNWVVHLLEIITVCNHDKISFYNYQKMDIYHSRLLHHTSAVIRSEVQP